MNIDFDELTEQKLNDVMYLVKDNTAFLGLDYKVVGELYRRFSNTMYCANWMRVDSRIRDVFIKWCITSPLSAILNEYK